MTQIVSGLLPLALGLLVSRHQVSMPALYGMGALLGLVNLFDNPDGGIGIANAVSLNSVLMNAGRLIGPGVAAGFALAMGLVGAMPTFTGAEVMLVPTGALSIALISTGNSYLQTKTSQEMRGRVMSFYAIGFLGTTPIGAPLIGLVIDRTSPRVGVWLGASVSLATGVLLARAARRQRYPAPEPSAAYR